MNSFCCWNVLGRKTDNNTKYWIDLQRETQISLQAYIDPRHPRNQLFGGKEKKFWVWTLNSICWRNGLTADSAERYSSIIFSLDLIFPLKIFLFPKILESERFRKSFGSIGREDEDNLSRTTPSRRQNHIHLILSHWYLKAIVIQSFMSFLSPENPRWRTAKDDFSSIRREKEDNLPRTTSSRRPHQLQLFFSHMHMIPQR